MPAEWEPHEATWLGWPHKLSDWPGRFAPIPWVYGEIVRRIAPGETVRILVDSAAHEAGARKVLEKSGRSPCAGSSSCAGPPIAAGRGTTARSSCAARRDAARSPSPGSASTPGRSIRTARRTRGSPARAARHFGLALRPASRDGRDVVLEGGSIDVNGAGTLVTTEECLLDPEIQVRNPGFGRRDYEEVLRDVLGATNVIWLGRGIAGDDTHGHVDDICRFVGPRTLVACRERDPADANHGRWRRTGSASRARASRTARGRRWSRCPCPRRWSSPASACPPATRTSTSPTRAVARARRSTIPRTASALGMLAELIRDRPVVGIHAVDLVWGLGTLHCLTQQQPAA